MRRQVHPAWLLLPLAIALGVLGYQHQKAFEAAQHKSSIQRGTNDLLDRASGQKPW